MIIVLIILAVYLLLITAGPALILHIICDRHINYKKLYKAEDFGIREPELFYLTTDDGYKIETRMEAPETPAKAVLVIVSGIDGPTITSFYAYAKAALEMGYAVFMPELRGHGGSDGDRICLAFEETADTRAVVRCARERFPGLPVVLMGLSMGAGTILRSIGEDPDIRAFVSLSGFSSIQDFIYAHARKYVTPLLALPLRPISELLCSWKYRVDAAKATPINGIRKLAGRPILLVHSNKDSVVPFYCFKKIKAEAEKYSNKLSTHIIQGDRHLIAKDPYHPEEDTEFWKVLTDFLKAVI